MAMRPTVNIKENTISGCTFEISNSLLWTMKFILKWRKSIDCPSTSGALYEFLQKKNMKIDIQREIVTDYLNICRIKFTDWLHFGLRRFAFFRFSLFGVGNREIHGKNESDRHRSKWKTHAITRDFFFFLRCVASHCSNSNRSAELTRYIEQNLLAIWHRILMHTYHIHSRVLQFPNSNSFSKTASIVSNTDCNVTFAQLNRFRSKSDSVHCVNAALFSCM